MPNQNSRLCVECHRKDGWLSSSHSQSNASWNGQGLNPWPASKERTVAGNACRNCHETHQTGGGPTLLRYASKAENCASCHNGNVASHDVMSSFEQFSAHPVISSAQAHDPTEAAVVTDRHVACSDCHDPHKTPTSQPVAGGAKSTLQVRGVDTNNVEQKTATRDYQVCLRCHGDSPGKRTPQVRRQLDQNNVRAEIQPGNPSFHPIAAPGRNPDVPSLIAPWNEQSVMDCVDCHNSSSAATSGGTRGPHGSSFEPILVMNYETTDNSSESPNSYALCYSCHSRDSILNDESFQYHDKHIRGERTPCSVCHDAHGVSMTQGNNVNNSHLINFDTTTVAPNQDGQLRFVDQGRFSGSCDLSCHGKNHSDENY
jgi:predicted CXXCH cytochrome family protein